MSKKLELHGLTFGNLTALERVEKDKYGRYKWLCKCSCGNLVKVLGFLLVSNHTKSCGCYRDKRIHDSNFADLVGMKFGKLSVLKLERMDKRVGAIWVVACECGSKEFLVRAGELKSGHTKSCGCLRESHMATVTKKYFNENYKSVSEYKKIRNPLTGHQLKYDLYLFDFNIFIEFHGRQHYEYVQYFHKNILEFEKMMDRDKIKKKYAQENGRYLEIDLRIFKDADSIIEYIEKII